MPTAIVCACRNKWARVVLLQLLGYKRSKVDNACLKSERFLNGRISEPDLLRWSHHSVLVVEVFFF